MRLLTILFSLLVTVNCFANYISTYEGQIYESQAMDECYKEYANIKEKMESDADFIVLDGSCAFISATKIQPKLTYSQPLAKRILRYSKKASNESDCFKLLNIARADFTRAEMNFINSYCARDKLIVDYIDNYHRLFKQLDLKTQFESKEECINSMASIQSKLESKDVFFILGVCESVKLPGQDKFVYIPRIDITSKKIIKIRSIVGKRVENSNQCFENADELRKKFSEQNLEIIDLQCGKASQLTEIIHYVENNINSKKNFKGNTSISLNECQNRIENIAINLERTGGQVIYQFCDQVSSDKFIPTLFYY